MPELTVVIPIISHDFLKDCLESLYKYTPVDFRVIVIDQTPDGIFTGAYPKIHMYIRPWRNLGFSKAMNTGIVLSQTPYVCLLNDDVEFLDNRWWQGVLDAFGSDERIMAVNPMCPKEGSWGYGMRTDNIDTWQPKEGFVTDEDKLGVYPKIGEVEIRTPELARENYDKLLNEHPTWAKDSACDAIAMWCTVFKREGLERFGLLDEQFYPGGGEDYDYNCRVYSEGCRMVGTTRSWVWHKWGSSKDQISGKDPSNSLFASRERWNANEELWGPDFDVWGMRNLPDGTKEPLKRKRDIFIDSL
jgi:GT2 family glycosyltransferase